MAMSYYKNKEENIRHAQSVVRYVEKYYKAETDDSAARTIHYKHMLQLPVSKGIHNTEVKLIQNTTVDAIFAVCDGERSVCALNFASYKNGGGMFLEGSMAQEESLCHEGNLYNILSEERIRNMFYIPNQDRLNRGLYHSNLLFTPDVLFNRKGKIVRCNIITCAAPNRKMAQAYQVVPDKTVREVLEHRIDSVLWVASKQEVDVLILGAFGTGVFGNDLKDVSEIFKNLLSEKYSGHFKEVIFAIPDDKSFQVMKNIISGEV